MANKKINELVTRTPSLSDLILVGDPSSGYSYKATVTALATIIETDIADGFVTIGKTAHWKKYNPANALCLPKGLLIFTKR